MRGSWVMVLLAFCGAGFAVGAELPLPPSGRVLDEAGLFDRKPRKLEVISQRLNGFVEEHGLPVYLVIYGGLIGEQIDQRSRQLHEAWIGRGQDGLIVVWDSDTGELEFGLPRATYYDAGLRDGEVTRLPDQRVRPVLDEVRAQVEGIAGKTEYAERVSEVLVAQLDGMFRQGKQERGVPVGSVALATVVVGGVLALLGLWSGRFFRREESAPQRKCFFPDVLVGGRLGASCGGGLVAVVDYDREEPEEEE